MTESRETAEMPKPTAWPMTLALAIMLAAAGLATNLAFSAVGLLLIAIGIAGWIGQLLPERGTEEVPWARPSNAPAPFAHRCGERRRCQACRATAPNYRTRHTPTVPASAAELPEGS